MNRKKEGGEPMVTNSHGLRIKKDPFIVVLLVSLLLSGCSQFQLAADFFGSSADNQSHTLIMDDFSDKDSGWGQFIYPEGSAAYRDGAYQIAVNVPNSDIFITYPRVYINSTVQADVKKVSGSNDNNFGLICRYEDERNFYAGQISSDGYAGIFRVKNGAYQLIGREQMAPVPAILGGDAVNQLRFDCIQNTLTLTVNGEVADTQTDDAFTSGEVGVIAGTINDYSGVFLFDNFSADTR
jgi:hypothetical protein